MKVALVGAGGKMGARLSRNFVGSEYSVLYIENDPARRAALEASRGVVCQSIDTVGEADVVVLAIPDNAIGAVARRIAPSLQPGTMIMVLDAAAPYAGDMPERQDLTYFIAHPCHPSMFNWESEASAAADTFGGMGARQAIVCALMQGPEADYEVGARIASTFFAPVSKVHRATLEQMALLEPVLSETITATLLTFIREAMDEAASRGVPLDMSRDFILGHIYAEAAVIFGHVEGVQMSDGCLKAIENARPVLFNPGWREVFEPQAVMASIKSITTPN